MPSQGDAHTEDLRLAARCAAGDRASIARLEAEHLSRVPLFVARISREPSFVDEVVQRLRERLLVAPAGGQAKIVDYRGRGPLAGFIRVVAVRAALDLQRERARGAPEDDLRALPRSPEIELARRRDGRALRDALTVAIESLDPEERAILRLAYVDGLSVAKVGAIYGVHAATISRRLSKSRETILARVRAALFEGKRLRAPEIQSLADLVESQLELSLTRLLGGSKP